MPALAPDAVAMPELSSPILSLRNLTVAFRSGKEWNTVVREVSFDIGAGETVAVVGESGSGKSVTALSILGLTPRGNTRTSGSIHFAGRDMLRLPNKELEKIRGAEIGMIFQEPMTSLNPVLTIGYQIAETLVLHRGISWAEARAETIRLLERVNIPAAASRFDDYPHQFSGGMRQRVMIAIALACKPRLLIADEPTTALDVTIQQQILELIKELQDDVGMSVLFITHDMGVMAEIADRTVVMLRGDAVETGSTTEIFARAAHPYTRALISAVPRLGSMRDYPAPRHFAIVDSVTGEQALIPDRPDTVRAGSQPVISVQDLVTRFDITSGVLGRVTGRVHAVENVSFNLLPGETLAVVGESGCGKSTTGRSIMQLNSINSGRILINNEDIATNDRAKQFKLRRTVQMIFQDPFSSLNPRTPIGDSIAGPMILHGLARRSEARDRVAGLLERVGLHADMIDRLPHEFSGGQRQRLCIARALAVEPQAIIADEAVSALDVSVKAQVINLMLDLQEQFGLAYLFISHDMAVVERISHRVTVMYLGEIVETGPRGAIFANPQHPYTRRLLAAVPKPDPAQRQIRRGVSNAEIRSPVRPVDYVAPPRQYREVSPGHIVQDWDSAEWPA